MGVGKILMESEFDGSRDIPLTDIMFPKNLTHTEKKIYQPLKDIT